MKNYQIQEYSNYPVASEDDWTAACDIGAVQWEDNKPTLWALYDGYGDLFAIADVFGGRSSQLAAR